LIARFGYSGQDFGLRNIPRFREHANGWTWLAMVRADTWQCVQLSLTSKKPLPPLPAEFGFPARLRGADVTWRLVRDCAGPGYFICGDAAMTLDPAASRGVARALQSGTRAADLAAKVHDGNLEDGAAEHSYREWLASGFMAEARQLAFRHSVLRDAPRWVRRFADQHAAA
jgi:2-polyprenyl-6-methoxyphenol hydroxylase-like FAD-dependent oxidoreductase